MILLFCSQVFAGKALADEPEHVIVEARLVNAGATPSHCGTMHFATVMKYEVVRVVRGRYAGRHIYVIQGCPELSRERYGGPAAGAVRSFRVGAVHRLTLDVVRPRTGDVPSIVDRFGDRDVPTFWALRTDPVPLPAVRRPG